MKLLEPGYIGKVRLKNRVVMSAMGPGALVQLDGSLSQRGIDYYVARAKGGVGLITTGSTRVTREFERVPTSPIQSTLMVDHKNYTRWVHELAAGVHDYGAKLAVQLTAGLGRALGKADLAKVRPIGPSPLPCLLDPKTLTHELTLGEIERILDAFEAAAEVLKLAQVDIVELNCHNGYLVDQFMTPLWNQRKDDYGGDLDNRLRFLVQIVGRLKKGLGREFPVAVKYALTHYHPGGREPEEGVEIARKLEAAGVDALTIDAGCRETFYWTLPSEFQPEAINLELAALVKQAVKIPVVTVGKMGNPRLAEQALREGKADFIAMGRGLLADPDWVNKVKGGRTEDIIPCVDCFEGCHRYIHEGKAITCAVNPATGNEREFALAPAAERKSVLVIGGGPGGMEAARVAALRGHRVQLWEKEGELGGNMRPGSGPEFKEIYRRLNDYLRHQLKKHGVEVALEQEATPERVKALGPDAVVVATGSTPVIPGIAGADRANVVTANDLLTGQAQAGATVVIIGGGVVGCETALYLAQLGKKVSIVELQAAAGGDMYYINRMHMMRLLAEAEIEILTRSKVSEIAEAGVVFSDAQGERRTLPADTVVLAVGFRPTTGLLQRLEGTVDELFPIGDCLGPRKVMEAMQEGYRVARLL
ncbi:FAD-dependent oxidoreductase [Ramlibacter sp. G-1-2-2]|uniref:FAD-dependent oxidoreductase n=1 Tax=Ramlibacter agri TaxID=2728837 RepID=A0A848H518_9BURK|nr:FAD-dependent oxidoreductase [Ramlibacter agri]NML42828.1 FAD-dependent oxidoreductase [Ramlibacter agri]